MTPPWLPGLMLAGLGAAVGYGIHLALPAVPWLTAALVVGVIVGSVRPARPRLDGPLKPGLAVAARRLLRLGIVVLGLKLSLTDIAGLGVPAILGIVALVVASFAVTLLIGRWLKLEGDQPVLLAAGFSICGVSAVGAMAAARDSDDRDSAVPIAMVTVYGTLAIVVLPVLASALSLDPAQFGHWAGASVHDVGQVVATASTAGTAALAVAVVVKLTRVLMLAPMVALASVGTRRRGARDAASAPVDAPRGVDSAGNTVAGPFAGPVSRATPPLVPLFIVGFLVAVLLRSFVPLPDALLSVADVLQSALLAAALFAIGASLRLEKLVRTGGRAFLAGALAWAAILAMAYVTLLLV